MVGDLGAFLRRAQLDGALFHQVFEVVAVAAQLFFGALALVDLGVQRIDRVRELRRALRDPPFELGMRHTQRFFGLVAADRIADRADQQGAVDLTLDEIVLRPRLQRLHRDALVGESAQHDERRNARAGEQPLQRFEAGAFGQAEVEQHDVEVVGAQSRDARGETVDPAELEAQAIRFGEHELDQPRVGRVVFDQQDLDRRLRHFGGSVTTVSQNSSIVCTMRVNWSKSTGFVT